MKINGWPLPKNIEARLVAVGSPDALGPGLQWRTHAYFVPREGDPFSLRLPWGMLPALRPGAVIVDGYIAGQLNLDNPFTVPIDSVRLERWSDATRDETGWYRLPDLQNEWCVVAEGGGERLVIPCVQVARAFHAPVRLMCHAVLRLAILSEFATTELQGETLVLRIARLVPDGVVTRAFARYLARLLTEPVWSDSFSSVFHHRIAFAKATGADVRSRIALQCLPPQLPAMRWTVRGESLSTGAYFVWDLVRSTSGFRPPYRYLRVVHTRRKSATPRVRREASVHAEGTDGSSNTGTRQYDPRQLSRPLLIRQRAIEHEDVFAPKFSDAYPEPESTPQSKSGGGGAGAGGARNTAPASLDEERKHGSLRSGEFHGIPGRDDPPLHFLVVAKALTEAVADRPDWQIRFVVEELVSHIPACRPADRLVLFSRIETPVTVAHIVELEPLEAQVPYTLTIVRRKDPGTVSVAEVGGRLNRWLTGHGRSHIAELQKEDAEYDVLLSTHRDLGTRSWADRILRKVSPPDRRPTWTRGIAAL